MAIRVLKPMAFGLFRYFFVDNYSFMDKIYSHCIYVSTVMNIHATERPNGHDNNLSVLYVISFIVCNVSVCNMQNLLHGKVRPDSFSQSALPHQNS